VIFLFTTGEVKGLLGANYYVDNPLVPLHRTVANINVDGIALFDTFNDVVGVGADLSTLGEEFEVFVASRGLRTTTIPAEFSRTEAFTRSDQLAFAEAGVPAMLIMEGLSWRHASPEEARERFLEWGRKMYHSPFDDLNQPLNFEAALQHCNLILDFCVELASGSFQPEWYPGSPYIHARLQSIAEKR
jgi:Zn-dependent M28 family amino/carboxypeptidase